MSLEYIGYIAGFCTTVAYLPQLLQILRTGSVKDVSLYTYLILTIGIFFWTLYGVYRDAPSVIYTNAISLCLTFSVLVLKVRDMWKKGF